MAAAVRACAGWILLILPKAQPPGWALLLPAVPAGRWEQRPWDPCGVCASMASTEALVGRTVLPRLARPRIRREAEAAQCLVRRTSLNYRSRCDHVVPSIDQVRCEMAPVSPVSLVALASMLTAGPWARSPARPRGGGLLADSVRHRRRARRRRCRSRAGGTAGGCPRRPAAGRGRRHWGTGGKRPSCACGSSRGR
jgi:hypothetical protein